MIGYSLQTPDHIGEMRAEYAPVGMHLVDDHEAQVPEKVRPVGVVRQDAGVQHIRVGKNDLSIFTDGRAVGWGGVAIVNR